jgi:hypothetical protein
MIRRIVFVGVLLSASAAARGQAAPPTRGQLLYENHCIACHSTQMHWRERRLVSDWESLLAQVRRWQGVAHLNWSDGDIEAVARHLNEHIYRLPRPDHRAAGRRPSPG